MHLNLTHLHSSYLSPCHPATGIACKGWHWLKLAWKTERKDILGDGCSLGVQHRFDVHYKFNPLHPKWVLRWKVRWNTGRLMRPWRILGNAIADLHRSMFPMGWSPVPVMNRTQRKATFEALVLTVLEGFFLLKMWALSLSKWSKNKTKHLLCIQLRLPPTWKVLEVSRNWLLWSPA